MKKPRLLDLFCGAGGAAMGYHRAGFDVVGVDLAPQPRYPFAFIQADAIQVVRAIGHLFDAIHASPPCQAYSVTRTIWKREHPDLVPATRAALISIGRPWAMENVVGAPLLNPFTLCGGMFGLRVYRHRLFESHHLILTPTHPRHEAKCTQVGRRPQLGEFMTVAGHFADVRAARAAMGIDWMTRDELAQAIPPAYTEHIGRQLIAAAPLAEAA